ncbi:MFS general substrate transporter [Auricularia subglabra TFB-10046 SS5]|uniref:MFS general substrate transporter n=1 Tax=Auricularia subglabra (strain TFB-10046 / SS5) TaxID=717982 RepID=J0WS28_AURST|nr:MFS general substrate transporter [Auricularia subglabra TFB-10046 SS5]
MTPGTDDRDGKTGALLVRAAPPQNYDSVSSHCQSHNPPRRVGLGAWLDINGMTFGRAQDLDMDPDGDGEDAAAPGTLDARSPLDRTIDRIGMGNYQWALLTLCGMGWLADNMWLQAVAIILPRVQQHYQVSDHVIGVLSTCMFAGMMIGAIGWGTCSDFMGRTTAFNATLFFTAAFGLFAAFSWSFNILAFALFLLGSAVGGSMPTDGTLLLEQLPRAKHYMLTGMSVFFSVGAVLSCIVGILVIPPNSCPATGKCDIASQNLGWKYLLMALSAFTAFMFACRIVFFNLHESPRFLVATGRHEEALVSLRKISSFNGSTLQIGLADVSDVPAADAEPAPDHATTASSTPVSYDATGAQDQPMAMNGHTFHTPTPSDAAQHTVYFPEQAEDERPRHARSVSVVTTAPVRRRTPRWLRPMPRWVRRPALAALDKVGATLVPEWRATTLLVWAIWFLMSTGYTMVNVYMPKLLERSAPISARANPELQSSMADLMVYTLAGLPGPLVAAYLVELNMGRRGALALSTFMTVLFYGLFTFAHGRWGVWVSTFGSNVSASTMWAVLYGMTPEIFETEVRGTACGTASALSRIGGIIAPLLGGYLLVIDPAFTVYVSIVVLLAAGILVLFLRPPAAAAEGEGYQPVPVLAH